VEGIEKSGNKEEELNRVELGRRAKIRGIINFSKEYRKVLILEEERNDATISSMILLFKAIKLEHNF
jgi:hypothetical protein